MRVRGRRRRINGEQGSEAQPGRPARRRGRGVSRGDFDGAGQAVMPAVRRDADRVDYAEAPLPFIDN